MSQSTPQTDPQDIVVVCNIDTDCDCMDVDHGYSHKDQFIVFWSGKPFGIQPGKTRRFPRFVAEHYAKHLADHILIEKGKKVNKFLLNSSLERPKVLAQILVAVDEYYNNTPDLDEGTKASLIVDELNTLKREEEKEKSLDIGELPNAMLGVLKAEPKEPEITEDDDDDIALTPPGETSLSDPTKPLPPMKELRETAKTLGIDYTGKETQEEIAAKIRAF